MSIEYEAIVFAYAAATVVGVLLGANLWYHREKTGAAPMGVFVVGSVLWSGSLLVAAVVDGYAISAFMSRFLFVGVGASVLGAVLFTLEYTGREHLVTREAIALLSIEPIVAAGLAFWNPRNVFFETIGPDPTTVTGVVIEWGIAFDAHTLYSYVLSLAATVMIFEFLYSSRALYRGQAAALFAGSLAPLASNLVHLVGSPTIDTTPIGFAVAGALYSFAIVRYRLIDVTPIARDRVLDTVSEGVFVADRDDRLVDVNPSGRRFIDVDERASLIGRHVDSLFADAPAVRDLYHDLTAAPDESSAELARNGSYYEVHATPIDDGRDRHVGWLVLASDITDRKRREERLERQNERLERFADLVSHDLRNPLNVADGYLELAREADDTAAYLDEIEQSHERMETIIEDVLALAREGADVTDPEPVALAAIARRAWNGVDTGAASMVIDADASIFADPERTTRLLENLFRNSLEHGTERADGADLEIAVGTLDDARDGSVAGFYVADDGVGIPPSQRDRVFEGGYTTDEDGTGFGLAIVAEIAAAHGWTSTVTESDAGGARFEFRGVEPTADATTTDADSDSDASAIGTESSQF